MSKNRRFTVELTAMAHVRQRRNVMASSKEEAKEKALANHADHTWDYQGVEDETIKIKARSTEVTPL